MQSRLSGLRRGALATAAAAAISVGALLSPSLAGATFAASTTGNFTTIMTSSDGKLTFICYYDDRTGQLLYCDVHINTSLK